MIADDLATFCVEHGVTDYELWARFYRGVALTRRGDLRQGIEVMQAAMKAASNIEARGFRPLHLGHLATCYGSLGQPQAGIELIDEGILAVERTEERLFEAELHRRRGDLLAAMGRAEEAAAALDRALTVARAHAARLWELRAATSLTRLWAAHGRCTAARNILAPAHAWFTEGRDGPDLREAQALLAKLG
jgi:predicted ATPase